MTRSLVAYLGAGLLSALLCLNSSAFAQAPPAPAASEAVRPAAPAAPAAEARKEVQFTPVQTLGDLLVTQDTVWRGEVLVEGAVTVGPQATLTVEAGTVVRFRQKGDKPALLMVQGRIVAPGTKEAPIAFTSTYTVPAAGDWQGVLLLGSEKKNQLENVRIDGALTGLEGLFSQVTLKGVRAERCRTGMRFQDALVVMETGGANGCDNGLVFVESEATLRNLNLVGNKVAVSALRSALYLFEGSLAMNRSAVSADNSRVKIQGGGMLDNGRGVTLFECQGLVSGVKLARNSDYGISLSGSRVKVSGNVITGNGQSGILVFDGASVAWGNAIHDNTGYDLYNAGKEEYRAPGNWWGTAPKIYDNGGEGPVITTPQLPAAP